MNGAGNSSRYTDVGTVAKIIIVFLLDNSPKVTFRLRVGIREEFMALLYHFAYVVRCRVYLLFLRTNVKARLRSSKQIHFWFDCLVFLEVAEIFSNNLRFELLRELDGYTFKLISSGFFHEVDRLQIGFLNEFEKGNQVNF